ncbi:hypothetical protein RQP54_00455 [Curvibacter sp. APW13]|uniref:hypothetical protein n=1 Tax=Curvibacter sp. APW13 TaxID=3077236 RepID=UPI0028DD46FE|nr:hypothetical protein [Curvibacter sp. APW13]MDT8989325.1 hypothetical protein [Curvibacter sp. APW13]
MDADFSTLQAIGLALSIPVLYAAWHEYSQRNLRDAKLLAGCGAGGLLLVATGFAL